MKILRIFSCREVNILLFVTDRYIAKYNIKTNQVIAQEAIEADSDIRNIYVDKNKIAVAGKFRLFVTDMDLTTITSVTEKFPIQSAFWES